MKLRGRWAVVGLLCVCGTLGCASLPSRDLFARRPKPAAPKEVLADDADEDFFADASTSSDRVTEVSRDSNAAESTGGLFDVSSFDASTIRSAAVEAPTPKRRSAAESPLAETRPPNAFVPADNLRELRPEPLPNAIETASGSSSSPAQPVELSNVVVTADEVHSAAGGYSSNIELAAGQQPAGRDVTRQTNPWDRFRHLEDNLDADANPAAAPPAFESSASPDRVSPRWENLPAALPAQPQWPTTNPAPAWPQAMTPIPANEAAPNNPNTPELWPRTPGANANSTPTNVQWVHAEQTSASGATTQIPSSFSPSTATLAPTANGPLNVPFLDSAPAVMTPFATSPELERLITQTTVEAAALTPGDQEVARQLYLRKHVQLRLLHLIAGQMDRALQPVPGIDPADQEFWQQMLWGMANYFDTQGMPDSAERAAQTIAPLKAAAARLQEKARLELRHVAFCHKISGYGNYQRFKRDEFTPGHPVLLYAEVGNFKSELLADGQFRTLLKSTLEILEGGPSGRVIETLPLMPSEDRCRNQRRDYYHSYEFTIPQSCNPGPHTLRLRVEDQLGKKVSETTLNFTVQ